VCNCDVYVYVAVTKYTTIDNGRTTHVVSRAFNEFLIPSLFHPIGTGASSSTTVTTSTGCSSGFVTVPIPIKRRVVVRVALWAEQVAEHPTKVRDVRFRFEFQRTAVCEVLGELRWTTLTQGWDRNRLLLFHDQFVLLRGRFRFEALPRQSTLQKVHEDVPDRFQIISTWLFDTQMVVDRGVTWRTSQRSTFPLRNVL